MKVAVCSDIHLEFGPIVMDNPEGANVLILSGDILVAADLFQQSDPYGIVRHGKYERIKEFFDACSANFPHVVYIMGNHEHYHGDFAKTTGIIRDFLKQYDNVYFLDKDVKVIDDITFIGGTLWTDMNKRDPLTMHSISGMMNDYRGVKNSNRYISRKVPVYEYDENGKIVHEEVGFGHTRPKEIAMKRVEQVAQFSPEDSVEDHEKMLGFIQSVIEGKNDEKFVVVGHHAPSKASTHPRYQNETLMNGAYSSDLSEYILDHPQIKLWTHGHTHEDFDYMIGSTRIVCNPRGYINYEERADNFTLKVVEV